MDKKHGLPHAKEVFALLEKLTRSRNASGFYFWCSYNYFNSYLDIRQDALKYFLLNLNGVFKKEPGTSEVKHIKWQERVYKDAYVCHEADILI